MQGARIDVLVERRYLHQREPAGLVAGLRAADHRVRLVDADRPSADAARSDLHEIDMIVARGRSAALLSWLRLAEAAGIPTINSRVAIEAVLDKFEMSASLAAAGIRTPPTYTGPLDDIAATLPTHCYPVVVKPRFGDNCRGISLASTPQALAALPEDEPLVVQPFVPNDGTDLKLYGIGAEVWAVRKPSPWHAPDVTGAPEVVELTSELEALGRACAEVFGLELYGVDCVLDADGPIVIEVNDYPNYSAIPDAGRRLARFVTQRSREADR